MRSRLQTRSLLNLDDVTFVELYVDVLGPLELEDLKHQWNARTYMLQLANSASGQTCN